jgi:transcriptional regulator with XRE-family HTH domain
MLDKKTFGQRVKSHRKAAGLGQRDVAAALGISLTMVSFYECGRNVPTLERFTRLCDVIDCRPDDLLVSVNAA